MRILRSIFVALSVMACGVMHADDYGYLSIVETSGQTDFAISKIKNITFDDTYMLVNLTDGTQQKLPLQGVSKMFFAAETMPTGVQALGMQQSVFTVKDGVLRVKGATGDNLTIYDVSGKAVRNVRLSSPETEVNVSGLTKGVYIVKVGNVAKKVMNK